MNESEAILKELLRAVDSGQPVALATIVKRAGSSPRDVGAKMLIYPDGKISGTIGGGKFEHRVIQDSLKLLGESGRGSLKHYRFSKLGEAAIGMTCGGEAEVFIELFHAPARLFIFGGGHVGRELARLAAGSNFLITVIDDRSEMLDSFDNCVITHQASDGYLENLPEVEQNNFVVLLTSAHKTDRELLKRYIGGDHTYLGMMGSQAKIKLLFDWLKESGVSDDQLSRVRTPIGLEISAEGPYEIAISILAELIAVRNKMGQPRE